MPDSVSSINAALQLNLYGNVMINFLIACNSSEMLCSQGQYDSNKSSSCMEEAEDLQKEGLTSTELGETWEPYYRL